MAKAPKRRATKSKRDPRPNWIAEQEVVFVRPDRTRAEGRILVGKPVMREDNAECMVSLDGLGGAYGGRPRIRGEDTMQALVLGVQFLATMLAGFIESGGRVLDRDGKTAELGATFGELLRTPSYPDVRR